MVWNCCFTQEASLKPCCSRPRIRLARWREIFRHSKDKTDPFNALMERHPPVLGAPKAAALGNDESLSEIGEGRAYALPLMTTDPRVRRMFNMATHKVEYTHAWHRCSSAASKRVTPVWSTSRRPCGWPRAAPSRPPVPSGVATQGQHALIRELIQRWPLDPMFSTSLPPANVLFECIWWSRVCAARCVARAALGK
jgi:TetR/AcrR family transcriptional regulator, acrAB operon repressor